MRTSPTSDLGRVLKVCKKKVFSHSYTHLATPRTPYTLRNFSPMRAREQPKTPKEAPKVSLQTRVRDWKKTSQQILLEKAKSPKCKRFKNVKMLMIETFHTRTDVTLCGLIFCVFRFLRQQPLCAQECVTRCKLCNPQLSPTMSGHSFTPPLRALKPQTLGPASGDGSSDPGHLPPPLQDTPTALAFLLPQGLCTI